MANINSETIDYLRKAINLIWLIELSFIADDVINAISHGEVFDDKFMDIKGWFDFDSLRLESQARTDEARPGSILACEDKP